jgi:DMSO/TMAO reductase YedYZ molybdopterin-dependent catalytic subunit
MRTRIFAAVIFLLAALSGAPLAEAQTGGVSSHFRVTGEVQHRTVFDLQTLEALPITHENVWYFAGGSVVNSSFTGALLWDVLNAAGITVNPSVKNDILRKIVIVVGSDGYQAVIAAGELAPQFGGEQIIIAYEQDGKLLGADGFARMVVPGDKAGGRAVANIVRIEVRDTDDLED